MTIRIGPTFGSELAAAGLSGLQFAWGDDGTFEWGDAVTEAQRAAVLAIYAAHDPAALAKDNVRDAYVAAKAATEEFAADSTLAKARTAIIRQGQCLEALLLYLNRRIA